MDQIDNSSSIAIVDFQGFLNYDTDFVLKELCFTVLNKNLYHHFIFAPPFNWQQLDQKSRKSALWLKTFHHGFCWNSGHLPYNEISKYISPLFKPNLVILVKGGQKVQFLKQVCKNPYLDVRNIEDFDCSMKLSEKSYDIANKYHCGLHRIVKHCATQNVKIIENWIKVNRPNWITSSNKNACEQ